MSITFKSSSKRTETAPITGKKCRLKNILKNTRIYRKKEAGEIVADSSKNAFCYPATFNNGFIGSIFDAYNKHHDLILRPDDVWLAILTQFSLYVNGNSEELRERLVSHQGKIEITASQASTLYTANYSELVKDLTLLCTSYLKDSAVREWILPNFTTTTSKDVTVASVVMLSALQEYFAMRMHLCCGIPQITLLGTVSDWNNLRSKVEKLSLYSLGKNSTGEDIIAKWTRMLEIILDQFVLAAKGESNLEFWDKICHQEGGGSGPRYLSGWITAFTVFDEGGQWIGKENSKVTWNGIKIDNGIFPLINTNDVVSGIVSVPVDINDSGSEYKAMLFAGHLSFVAARKDTVQPDPNWSLALIDEEESSLTQKEAFLF